MLHRPIDAPAASLTTRPPSHPLQSQCDVYLAARPESVAWGYIDPKRGAQLVGRHTTSLSPSLITRSRGQVHSDMRMRMHMQTHTCTCGTCC